MARRAISWVLMLFTLALVGCDHATKVVAEATLSHRGPLSIVPGILDLRYTRNDDTAFSLLRQAHFPGKMALLAAFSLVAIGALMFAWWRRRGASRAEQAAYALLVAGAVGNVIDRVRRGYVVDFIEVHRWPVFNVADVAIVAGAALLAIVAMRKPRAPRVPAG